ncbi:MAG: hypothetical protein GYB67_17145 [Chloroflexi bacterium]|nr:hypothetical protein [Chloroflexota bacterium]
MRVVLYTDKTVRECMSAINERMQAKATSARPALDGWVNKSGEFSLGVSMQVAGRFNRTTYLRGKVEKQGGYSVVTCDVANGVERRGQIIVFIALGLVALVMLGSGNALFALILIPFALLLYIPMEGDHQNSETLVNEVQRTLKARAKPPAGAKPRRG